MAWLPYALGAGVVAALFMARKASAEETTGVPVTPQPIKPGQKIPPGAPAGSELAEVRPRCLPTDERCSRGMLLRTGPGTQNPLIAPEQDPNGPLGAPNPIHSRTGELVAVLKKGLKAPGEPAGNEWWEVMTVGGGRGFTRAIGPDPNQGGKPAPNFILTGQTVGGPPVVAGQAAIMGYGMPFPPYGQHPHVVQHGDHVHSAFAPYAPQDINVGAWHGRTFGDRRVHPWQRHPARPVHHGPRRFAQPHLPTVPDLRTIASSSRVRF